MLDAAPVLTLQQLLLQLCMLLRMQLLEAQVLQLCLDGPHSQPVCQGREDLHRFLGHVLPLGLRQGTNCAHVMKPVCELDQDTAGVCHAHESVCQFDAVQGLVGLLIPVELADVADSGDLADHVDQSWAEEASKVLLCHRGVVKYVVHQACCYHIGCETQLCQDLGRFDAVGEDCFAVLALLACMGIAGDGKGTLNHGILEDFVLCLHMTEGTV